MSTQICSQCHSTSFHFDRRRHTMVCDICGWDLNSSQRASEMLTYDQNRQKAIAFVKALDYISAKPFLENMKSIRPDDPDIYYLHLMGLTECCQNLLLESSDSQKFALVQNYWNTLSQLDGQQSVFVSYFNRRRREQEARREKRIAKQLTISIACYAPLFACVALLLSENPWCILPIIILSAIIVKLRPLSSLIKELYSKGRS